MVGEDMMPDLRIIWILILGGGKMFMVRMKMKRTMTMMMGARGAVLSVLLRYADDSSRGPIMILKVAMTKMRRKMLAHHQRRLDLNLQLHFVSSFFFAFLFPSPVLHLSASHCLFYYYYHCHTSLLLRPTYLPTYLPIYLHELSYLLTSLFFIFTFPSFPCRFVFLQHLLFMA